MTKSVNDLATEPNRAHPTFRLETASCQVALELLYIGNIAENDVNANQRPVHIIPQMGVPRWILPNNPSRALTVLTSWKPYSLRSFAQWKVILTVCRIGALAAMPGMLKGILRSDHAYWHALLPDYSEAWDATIYVGHPSSTRKAIMFFVDKRARVKAVAKIPISLTAKTAILNEASILRFLGHRLPLPEVLFTDQIEGIAGQSWMEGVHVSSNFRSEHLHLLSCLVYEGAEVCLSDYRDPLAAELESQNVSMDALLQKRALSLLERNESLPAFTEHRDCVPWNMRRLIDGQLTLIDWEWAIQQGLPWQDICRYFYMQDYLFKKSADVWEILRGHALLAEYRRRFGLSLAAVQGLTMHYLIRSFCENHSEGNLDRAAYMERKIREVLQ